MNKIALLGILLTIASCGQKNETNPVTKIEPEVTVWEIKSGTPSSVEMGEIEPTAVKNITVKVVNTGNENLIGTNLQLDSSNFSILSKSGCDLIKPTLSCSIKVALDARNKPAGPYSTNLTLDNLVIAISATINPPPAPEGKLQYTMSNATVEEVNFGLIKPTGNIIKAVTIKNLGNSVINSPATIPGAKFLLSYDTCSNKAIPVNGTCQVRITLSGAGKSGEVSDVLSFAGAELPLIGEVETVEQTVAASNVIALYSNNEFSQTSPLNLGNLELNKPYLYSFNLKNIGTGAEKVVSISFSSQMQLVTTGCSNLVVGGTCAIKAQMSPSAVAPINMVVTYNNNLVKTYPIIFSTISAVPACSLANAASYGVSMSGVLQVSGNTPSCLVAQCAANLAVSADQKSCAPVSCDLTNASSGGVNLSQVTGVVGNLPSCSVSSCAENYTLSANLKSCEAINCSMLNAASAGVNLTQVLEVSGQLPSCVVSQCQAGFVPAGDQKSCVSNSCTLANASSYGVNLLGVAAVSGLMPNCVVSQCTENLAIAGDQKSCQPIACSNENATIGGVNLNQVIAVSGNLPNCSITQCQENHTISADQKSCSAVACDISNAGSFGVTLAGVLEVSGNAPNCQVSQCESNLAISASGKSCEAIACTTTNADLGGIVLGHLAQVSGNLPNCEIVSCENGYGEDGNACVEGQSCDLGDAAANGVDPLFVGIVAEQGSFKGTAYGSQVSQCLINSCGSSYTVSADEKSCEPIACSMQNAVALGGISSLDHVLSVKNNLPNCQVDSCEGGYIPGTNSQSCIASTRSCLPTDLASNGGSGNNVATVSGQVVALNYSQCLVATCASGYAPSADLKFCNFIPCQLGYKNINGSCTFVQTAYGSTMSYDNGYVYQSGNDTATGEDINAVLTEFNSTGNVDLEEDEPQDIAFRNRILNARFVPLTEVKSDHINKKVEVLAIEIEKLKLELQELEN